ncbi:hypothetical protein FRB97_004605 [Tulasnella sp. 331]|nr:hypothetical protein FRB97_004605 [Tulasnella sp. 331]
MEFLEKAQQKLQHILVMGHDWREISLRIPWRAADFEALLRNLVPFDSIESGEMHPLGNFWMSACLTLDWKLIPERHLSVDYYFSVPCEDAYIRRFAPVRSGRTLRIFPNVFVVSVMDGSCLKTLPNLLDFLPIPVKSPSLPYRYDIEVAGDEGVEKMLDFVAITPYRLPSITSLVISGYLSIPKLQAAFNQALGMLRDFEVIELGDPHLTTSTTQGFGELPRLRRMKFYEAIGVDVSKFTWSHTLSAFAHMVDLETKIDFAGASLSLANIEEHHSLHRLSISGGLQRGTRGPWTLRSAG